MVTDSPNSLDMSTIYRECSGHKTDSRLFGYRASMSDQTPPGRTGDLCPDCGQPRPTDGEGRDPGVCTNPACPAGDEPEIAANQPTGGDDIGA